MGDAEPAGGADRLDLPGHPRGAFASDLVAPQRLEALHEPPRWVDLEVLAAGDLDHAGNPGPVLRSLGPLRFGPDAEAVLLAHLLAGDRLPEALRGRLDVDLEHGHRAASADHRVGVLV